MWKSSKNMAKLWKQTGFNVWHKDTIGTHSLNEKQFSHQISNEILHKYYTNFEIIITYSSKVSKVAMDVTLLCVYRLAVQGKG